MVKNGLAVIGFICIVLLPLTVLSASPQEDIQNFQNYFLKLFPGVEKDEFGNGVYAIDAVARQNWIAIEEFPPYEPFVDEGKVMWETPFANGKTYASCFPEGPAQRKNYPRWDKQRSMVVTMELAINDCRIANGEKPLKYAKGQLASLTAYMAYESRGQIIDVKIPLDDPKALAAYEQGKQFWLKRMGQLDLSCAHCHARNAGRQLRSDVLSPALGHVTGWPVYRSKWGEMGTLHRRFTGCNEQLKARPFDPQSEQYRNLEYFLTIMNNGLSFNGPSSRK
ncbi:sulfur oxidation protein [Achromatium sp. WMS2]|nr:sulfur oxidation protein [Achromatium sp. WMS2]